MSARLVTDGPCGLRPCLNDLLARYLMVDVLKYIVALKVEYMDDWRISASVSCPSGWIIHDVRPQL